MLSSDGVPCTASTSALIAIVFGSACSRRTQSALRGMVMERLGDATGHQVILCGHSHRQAVVQIPGGPMILNPGTVGCPVSADNKLARELEFRSPHARYAVLTRGHGIWGAELLRSPMTGSVPPRAPRSRVRMAGGKR